MKNRKQEKSVKTVLINFLFFFFFSPSQMAAIALPTMKEGKLLNALTLINITFTV